MLLRVWFLLDGWLLLGEMLWLLLRGLVLELRLLWLLRLVLLRVDTLRLSDCLLSGR